MSPVKSLASFFILVAILSNESIHQVSGVPVSKRGGRFLGKFSLVAGLGLPSGASLDRGDDYKPPVSSWGPYLAAIYEPMSFVSLFSNSLGYLAAVLDPFGWFAAGTTPAAEQTDTTSDDVLLLVNDDRNVGPHSDKLVNNFITPTSNSPSRLKISSEPKDKDADLIAEETTLRESIGPESIESEGRADAKKNNTSPTTVKPGMSTTTKKPTATTTKEPTTTSRKPSETPPTTSTWSSTGQWYPDNPAGGGGGDYYYGGYPQNVSHVAFTTRPAATRHFLLPPERSFQDFNEVDQSRGRFSVESQQQTFGGYDGFDLPPLVGNELLERADQYSGSYDYGDSLSSGFKPIFPYHHES